MQSFLHVRTREPDEWKHMTNADGPSGADATALKRPSQRIVAFDGARGFMALFVVTWHAFLLVSPSIQTWASAHARSTGAWWWNVFDPSDFLTYSIVVFFILSGIVITMPALRPGFSWWAYYPSRLLRLYLPVWGSLALGWILIVAFPRGYVPQSTWLGLTNSTHVGVGDALWQGTLLSQSPGLNNPLWSLTWEIAFSVSLPLYAFIALKTRNGWLWVIAASALVSAIGYGTNSLALMYMPTFLIGSVTAANLDKVVAAAAAINSSRRHTLWWSLILLASLISISGFRVTESMEFVKPYTLINHVLSTTTVLGYAGFLFIAMGCNSAKRFLGTRTFQWLGARSFSLYLVHVPILATLGFALIGHEWVAVVIGIPLSIVVAAVYARFVEQPCHRFAKRVGRSWKARAELRAASRTRLVTDPGDERV
jgi:peptidoglycan/LPS O-acetylase OafA/YrhL